MHNKNQPFNLAQQSRQSHTVIPLVSNLIRIPICFLIKFKSKYRNTQYINTHITHIHTLYERAMELLLISVRACMTNSERHSRWRHMLYMYGTCEMRESQTTQPRGCIVCTLKVTYPTAATAAQQQQWRVDPIKMSRGSRVQHGRPNIRVNTPYRDKANCRSVAVPPVLWNRIACNCICYVYIFFAIIDNAKYVLRPHE